MGAENRRYKRLSANWVVKIRTTKLTDTAVHRMQDRIKNISHGGVFIETGMPFDIGAHVELDFQIPGQPGPVHARGIVKWSNAEHSPGIPTGMGIEFLEVSTPHKEAIERYVEETSVRDLLAPLHKTPLHQMVLRFYCRKIGEIFPLDVLAQFLNCAHDALKDTLKDFVAARIAVIVRDAVMFKSAEEPEMSRAIQKWYAAIGHGDTPHGGSPR